MAGMNPRISVTLKPSLDAAIKRLSDATGQSKSSLVAELLEQAEPVLVRMATVIEAAHTATHEAKTRLAANLDEAQTKLEAHLGLVTDLFEEQTRDLIGDLESVGRRRAKGAGAPLGERKNEHAVRGSGARSEGGPGGSRPPRLTGGSHPTEKARKPAGKKAAKPSLARKGG